MVGTTEQLVAGRRPQSLSGLLSGSFLRNTLATVDHRSFVGGGGVGGVSPEACDSAGPVRLS